jgi:hypothetical protein
LKQIDLDILDCKDCKNFLKLISHLNRLKRVFNQISAIKNKIDKKKYDVECEFYEHLDEHFQKEES